jgi:hypothetical protein
MRDRLEGLGEEVKYLRHLKIEVGSGHAGYRHAGETNALSVPSVSDVEIAAFALNDGRIGILSGFVFEGFEDIEVIAIGADGEVERRAACGGVVEDEDDASVAEADGINAGVGVGQIGGMSLCPRDAVTDVARA